MLARWCGEALDEAAAAASIAAAIGLSARQTVHRTMSIEFSRLHTEQLHVVSADELEAAAAAALRGAGDGMNESEANGEGDLAAGAAAAVAAGVVCFSLGSPHTSHAGVRDALTNVQLWHWNWPCSSMGAWPVGLA